MQHCQPLLVTEVNAQGEQLRLVDVYIGLDYLVQDLDLMRFDMLSIYSEEKAKLGLIRLYILKSVYTYAAYKISD